MYMYIKIIRIDKTTINLRLNVSRFCDSNHQVNK